MIIKQNNSGALYEKITKHNFNQLFFSPDAFSAFIEGHQRNETVVRRRPDGIGLKVG